VTFGVRRAPARIECIVGHYPPEFAITPRMVKP
jgi:hypothetical protein